MAKISGAMVISVLLAVASLCFLTKFLIYSSDLLLESSRLKLYCLLLEHFFIIYMIPRLSECQTSEDYISWMTFLSTTIFLMVTLTQIVDACIHKQFTFLNALRQRIDPMNKVYLSLWLNVYLETWLYSFTCLSITCCTFSFSRIGQYCRSRRKQQFMNEKLQRISLEQLRDHQSICSICMVDYEAEDEIVKASCHHVFHLDCLLTWLDEQSNCPMCREVFY